MYINSFQNLVDSEPLNPHNVRVTVKEIDITGINIQTQDWQKSIIEPVESGLKKSPNNCRPKPDQDRESAILFPTLSGRIFGMSAELFCQNLRNKNWRFTNLFKSLRFTFTWNSSLWKIDYFQHVPVSNVTDPSEWAVGLVMIMNF